MSASKTETNVGRIILEIGLANNQDVQLHNAKMIPADQVRKIRLEATIDTGANHVVLPTAIAAFLGLQKSGEAGVRYADGRTARKDTVDQVELELLGRKGTFRALLEPDRTTALVGAIVLEDLDMLVDCTKQRVYPRDPERIIAEME